jgi:signal transduction histidine kinase
MVNNLLDRAQLEQGKMTIKNITFPVSELISTTQAALEVLAISKNIELTSEIDPNMPATLHADKIRLQQILFNLTSNALKFTEKGSVNMRMFKVDQTHWAMQVKDTGIGIPPEAQKSIFESFWQVDSSATRQYRGTGLGLSIVKELTELMKGTIQVESALEKGSTFTLIFPLESAEA